MLCLDKCLVGLLWYWELIDDESFVGSWYFKPIARGLDRAVDRAVDRHRRNKVVITNMELLGVLVQELLHVLEEEEDLIAGKQDAWDIVLRKELILRKI